MRSLIRKAEHKGWIVEFKPYESEFVKGYRTMYMNNGNRQTAIVINSIVDEETQYETLMLLIDLSEQHRDYGFISICGKGYDYKLYVHEQFKYNKQMNCYIYCYTNTESDSVVDISVLKGLSTNKKLTKRKGSA